MQIVALILSAGQHKVIWVRSKTALSKVGRSKNAMSTIFCGRSEKLLVYDVYGLFSEKLYDLYGLFS